MENVSVTTIERKQMSNKTTFKRISLAMVAALGFGVLSSGPTQAEVSGETLTATASATTIAVGDSVTVTVVGEFTSSASDTTTVRVIHLRLELLELLTFIMLQRATQ